MIINNHVTNIIHKCFVRKLKFVKLRLVIRKIMSKNADIITERDVDAAFSLKKIRLVKGLSRDAYAEKLSITCSDLICYEDATVRIPVNVIDRACILVGLTKDEFFAGHVDDLLDAAIKETAHLIPESLRATEIFDVLQAYALVKGRGDGANLQINGFLKMLVCGRPNIGLREAQNG